MVGLGYKHTFPISINGLMIDQDRHSSKRSLGKYFGTKNTITLIVPFKKKIYIHVISHIISDCFILLIGLIGIGFLFDKIAIYYLIRL